MNNPIKVLLPWNTSNFMHLNAFDPTYNFIIAKDRKSFSQLLEFQTFNQRLFLEILLFTERGGVLENSLKKISKKLQIEKQGNNEYKDTWDFFEIKETLASELSNSDLQVLHTTPLSVGIKPFIYHLESFETLFFPWAIHDPFLALTSDKKIKSIIEYLKRLLESPQCLQIISHLPTTLEKFKTVFKSDLINKKLLYCPLGFPLFQRNQKIKKNHFRFLYTSSLHKNLNNMERRGIRVVFQFIKNWLEKFPEDEFVLFLPPLEDNDFPDLGISKVLSNPHVYNFGNQYVSDLEFSRILQSSDFMLIPSLQLNSATLLKSMGAGVIPVVSDLSTVQELGISSKNSIILEIFQKLNKEKSPIFGEIPSLMDFNTQYINIAKQMINQLEFLKRNSETKTELSMNAQDLIKDRYDLYSASQQFSNIILESFRNNQKVSTPSLYNYKIDRMSLSQFLPESLLKSPENFVPLRPIAPEDYDCLPIYHSYLNLGQTNILSNEQHFLLDDYNKSILRGLPSLLSNNNKRESFMGGWEQNLNEAINQIQNFEVIRNSFRWKYVIKSYFNKSPRLKKFLKKIGVNKIARKIGLI